jgi:hypothetical protein
MTANYKPGMVIYYWYDETCHSPFVDSQITQIRNELPPALGIKKHYTGWNQVFYRIYKKKGQERID